LLYLSDQCIAGQGVPQEKGQMTQEVASIGGSFVYRRAAENLATLTLPLAQVIREDRGWSRRSRMIKNGIGWGRPSSASGSLRVATMS
jgi:hypothetical protein